MRSVMQHNFGNVPVANIARSTFNRSHGHKTTFDAGYLVPILVDIAYPGDTFKCEMSAFARVATMLKAPMDVMYLDSMFFAVPIRQIWTNWEKFNGAQTNPGDSTSYTIPQMTSPNVAGGGIAEGSLSDYFGLPTKALSGGGSTTGLTFNSWFHRAYNKIYNEWFRDENLQNSVTVDTGDGPDTYSNYVLLRRGKRADYFTTALPWTQKGTEVTLPLGTSATVKTNATDLFTGAQNALKTLLTTGSAVAGSMNLRTVGTTGAIMESTTANATGSTAIYPSNLYADLSSATAATINALRQAFQLQAFYEKDARGGTRYIEIIKSHFGVTSPDMRVQRSEYLGGGSTPINVHPVASTNAVGTGATAASTITSFGTALARRHGFTKSFTEHCVIIGLVNVRADLNYQQGVNRIFNYRTRVDMYWPSFAHLGEQSILNREIYANLLDGTGAAQKDGVFGYQERYAELRYKPSMVTGQFRSNATTPLDSWHLAQNFSSQPTLNSTFIQDDPPVDRIIAVPSEPHIVFDGYFDYICARPMPVFGVPGAIGRL